LGIPDSDMSILYENVPFLINNYRDKMSPLDKNIYGVSLQTTSKGMLPSEHPPGLCPDPSSPEGRGTALAAPLEVQKKKDNYYSCIRKFALDKEPPPYDFQQPGRSHFHGRIATEYCGRRHVSRLSYGSLSLSFLILCIFP
jgi:hypothetical protein